MTTMLASLPTLPDATMALRAVIARCLESGHRVAGLEDAVNDYVAARREAGVATAVPDMLVVAFSMIMEHEQRDRGYRDPYSRGVGDEDPVLSIANACVNACTAELLSASGS